MVNFGLRFGASDFGLPLSSPAAGAKAAPPITVHATAKRKRASIRIRHTPVLTARGTLKMTHAADVLKWKCGPSPVGSARISAYCCLSGRYLFSWASYETIRPCRLDVAFGAGPERLRRARVGGGDVRRYPGRHQ